MDYILLFQVRKKNPPDALAYMAEPPKHVGSTAVVILCVVLFLAIFF